jgi:hypothetical protein
MDNQDFTIEQGSTFNPVIRYPQAVLISKPLTNITKAGQAVITVATHGLQIDWPVYVVGVVGMAQINNRSRDLTSSMPTRCACSRTRHAMRRTSPAAKCSTIRPSI